jgi:integrase
MKGRITKAAVDRLEAGTELHDTEVVGFIARCLPSGAVSYALRYRTGGKRALYSIGLHGNITADQARTLAKQRAGDVAGGADPAAERTAARVKVVHDATKTVNAVLDNHVKRHVETLAEDSAKQIKSAFDRLVRPTLGARLIYELERSDISDLMDTIEDENGPVMADRTLAYLRKAFNWQMARENKWVSPIIKGMSRANAKGRERTRVLDDAEIWEVWTTLDRLGNQLPACYPNYIRALFLTAQRRTNTASLHADQIKDGNWIIEAEDYKTRRPHLVPITVAVHALLVRQSGFMFSSDGGKTRFSGFSKAKDALDAAIAERRKEDGRQPMPHWTLHDIRRTARSIMSRYTTPDHAERVIGHAIGGVRGVYDLYAYADEKRAALERLAGHILGVVHPDSSKIVPLRKTPDYVASHG